RDLNHCRSASMRVTSAIGVPHREAANCVISSKAVSGNVSRIAYSCRTASRSASLFGRGALMRFSGHTANENKRTLGTGMVVFGRVTLAGPQQLLRIAFGTDLRGPKQDLR